ncbi:MAG TPA: hypothetical protein VGR66_09555 [Candidatus Eisenbacteria bacterium]|nr:hypothetical protein [Candidatus Eisenbacteria bacterium]
MRYVLGFLALALIATDAVAASKPTAAYVHPQFAQFQIKTIALLPTVILPSVSGADQTMGQALERNLAPLGYRWVSASALRAALVAAKQPGVIDAVNERARKAAPADTAALQTVGQTGIADAVLVSVVSTWERETIDVTISGQSMTQIAMTGYLYSTRTGELLWSRKFQVKGEGPYNNADGSTVVGLKAGGLNNSDPRTSTSLDPPTYEEIAAKLADQVRTALPAPPAKPATP